MIYIVRVIPNYPDAILAFVHCSKTAQSNIFLKEMVSASVINLISLRYCLNVKVMKLMP